MGQEMEPEPWSGFNRPLVSETLGSEQRSLKDMLPVSGLLQANTKH